MKLNKKMLLTAGMVLAAGSVLTGVGLSVGIVPEPLSVLAETGSIIGAPAVLHSKERTKKTAQNIDVTPPVISAESVNVTQGQQVNVLENVTAFDEHDGDLTSQIKVEGTVDIFNAGQYTIKLSATDASSNTGVAEKIVTVSAPVSEAQETQETQEISAASAPSTLGTEESTPAAENDVPVETQTVSSQPAFTPNTMYLAGTSFAYQNGGQAKGQAIIDSNPNTVVSTWGGAAVQSGTDGLNTHFIGHHPGIFGFLFSLASGNQIVVTDANNTPTTYTATTFLKVSDSAIGTADGKNYWNLITGTDGGERITLQTCIDDTTNYIVIAYA